MQLIFVAVLIMRLVAKVCGLLLLLIMIVVYGFLFIAPFVVIFGPPILYFKIKEDRHNWKMENDPLYALNVEKEEYSDHGCGCH